MLRAFACLILLFVIPSCSLDFEKKASSEPDAGLNGDASLGEGGMDGLPEGGSEPECLPPDCDPCDASPCKNGGACEANSQGYSCTCATGFSGKQCQIDPCELDPCLHGGECKRKQEGRTCACVAPWQGDGCEVNTDARLASIVPSVGNLFPAFAPSVTSYSIDVGVGDLDISFVVEAAQPDGITVTLGDDALSSGIPSPALPLALNAATPRKVMIQSVADDGSERMYEITVRRTLVQQAYVKSFSPLASNRFGASDVLSASGQAIAIDGDLLVVGDAHRFGDNGCFELFGRSGGSWGWSKIVSQSDTGALLGAAVALGESHLVVGAPGVDEVRVYERKTLGRDGPDYVTLKAPSLPTAALFGYGLAISGDTIFVGAPAADQDAIAEDIKPWGGEVHVFVREGETWAWKQVLTPPPSEYMLGFGTRLAADGDVLAVGDPNSGHVYAFSRTNGVWALDGQLDLGPSFETAFGGSAVGVSGGRIAVAESYFNVFGADNMAGEPRVSVFSRSNGAWLETGTFVLPALPDIPADVLPRNFGLSGLAFEGGLMAVGASVDGPPGTGVRSTVDSGAVGGPYAGGVYLFAETAGVWGLTAYVKASNAEEQDGFGSAVALSRGTLVVAAPGEDSNAERVGGDQSDNSLPDTGAVYVFNTDCAQVPEGASVPGC